MVYKIQKLNADVKGVISQYKLDKNKNGKIDDNELPAVLAHGIKERYKDGGEGIALSIPIGLTTGFTAASIAYWTGVILTGDVISIGPDHPMYEKAPYQNLTGTYIERNYKHPRMVKLGNYLQGNGKGNFFSAGLAIGGFLLGAGLAIYSSLSRKDLYIPQLNQPKTSAPEDSLKKKYSDGFKQLGVDSELKEYTPKKGENWSKILKAKYGTDEVTAVRMAHRIKDVIYDDSLASKQTPIMYLPQSWKFDGKVYNYNDSAQVQTGKLGGNVKTEMGKMNPQIKYN